MSEQFGDWLKTQLQRREMTQADLARRADLPTSTVSNWITGRRIPDPKACDTISDALFVPLDEVLAVAGHRPRTLVHEPGTTAAVLHELVDRVVWNPDRAAAVEAILRGFIDRDRKQPG